MSAPWSCTELANLLFCFIYKFSHCLYFHYSSWLGTIIIKVNIYHVSKTHEVKKKKEKKGRFGLKANGLKELSDQDLAWKCNIWHFVVISIPWNI